MVRGGIAMFASKATSLHASDGFSSYINILD